MGAYPVKFGKYLLLERINVGGMAEVFKAKTFGVAGFERILAIKRILPSLVEDDEFIRMFIDEARIAVQLNHANIVQIYELGKHGEHYYIAMEYLPSRDVRTILDRMRSGGQLMPIGQAAYICSKACEGLDYAHRRRDPSGQPMNIIHRDVSPQNILITYEGEIKVIDFGIAKAANRASKTQAGVLKGKFGYMSPEQVRGLPIDRRSDIFAVGVLLYEMLTGERLFIGESDFSTLERVRNAEVIPPTTFNKKITPELEQIVLKALAREPEDRYQWSSDLAEDLQSFLIEDRSLYNAKRLASFMKETWSGEIAAERAKMEEHLNLSIDGDFREIEPSYEDLPSPHVKVKAPAPSIDTNTDPLPEKRDPRPANGQAQAGLDDFDVDAADQFEEDKTFVIEASEAGKILQPSHSSDDASLEDPAARPPRMPENTNDDYLGASSLYGEDASDLEDDSATMVSMANPFDEGGAGHTDAERGSGGHSSEVRSIDPDSETHVAFDYGLPGSRTSPSLDHNSPPSMTHDDGNSVSSSMNLSSGAHPSTPPFDPVTLAMAAEHSGSSTALSGPSTSASQGNGVAVKAPARADGMLARRDFGDDDATQRAPRSPDTPAQKLSPSVMAALIGGVAVAFLAFVTVTGAVVYKLASPSEVPIVLAPPDPASPPAEVKIFLEGELVAERLPVQILVPQAAGLRLRVEAAGFEPLDLPLPKMESSLSPLTLPLRASEPVAAASAPPPEEPVPSEPVAAPAEPEPTLAAASAGPAWRVSFTAIADGAPVHGARVFREGRFVGVTPFETELSSTVQSAAFEVRAEGYATKQLEIARGGRDQVGPATVRLVRPPADAPGAEPAEAAPVLDEPALDEPALEAAAAALDEAAADEADEADETGEAAEAETAEVAAAPEPPKEEPAPVAARDPAPERSAPAPSQRVAQRRKAKPKQVELALGTSPFAQVWVDGRKLDRTTPLMGARALKLQPGSHTFQFLDPRKNKRYRYKITLPADSPTNKIIIILGGDVRVKEGKATARELN